MIVVAVFGGSFVGVGEIDIVEWEDTVATIGISVAVADAGKGNFAAVNALRETRNFMEPAIEIVAGLDRVVPGDISSEDVAICIPGVGGIGEGWDRETVAAESVFDDSLERAFCPVATNDPFKLAILVIAIILALVPESCWDSNSIGRTERGGLPGGGDAVFVGNSLERHGADE